MDNLFHGYMLLKLVLRGNTVMPIHCWYHVLRVCILLKVNFFWFMHIPNFLPSSICSSEFSLKASQNSFNNLLLATCNG